MVTEELRSRGDAVRSEMKERKRRLALFEQLISKSGHQDQTLVRDAAAKEVKKGCLEGPLAASEQPVDALLTKTQTEKRRSSRRRLQGEYGQSIGDSIRRRDSPRH